MPVPFTGGCACGAIRYESSAAPLAVLNCHCRDCQRSSGTGFTTVAIVPTDSLRLLQGTPKRHLSTAESGNEVRREFCAECGTPLFAGGGIPAQFIAIKVGSLDDPSWCAPMLDIWTQSAQPWDLMNHSLPKFPKNIPPR
ncbi:GFA family protein [Archangium lansingense]|uniref:GFA family protein n=1 Tax=Archangium lansingense TaxID=2995310 RepID=A0ABT4ACE6_9BACT|nr:GFA family protein [Archangium lansinium]MCY1079340.1 GFA family protein [Archangium lansinium]